MAREVATLNFFREKGKLYYLDSDGDLVERDQTTKVKKVVVTLKIKKRKGHFYFLNKKGNIEMSKMKNQKK